MRGRKPKPIEQRIKEGNPGGHPLPEPLSVGGRPSVAEMEPPDSLPQIGKDFWKDMVPSLIEIGIVDRIDAPALEMLSLQFARIRQAQADIAKHGFYEYSAGGALVPHPAVKIEQAATTLFLKLAEQYALTPVARTRLGLAELHRRSMKQEMDERIGAAELQPA